MKLEIFKTGGSSVYTEWDNNPRGSVDGYNPIYIWNGKNTGDEPVAEGRYDVEVSLYYNGVKILWDRQNEAIIVAEILLTHIKFDHAPGSVSDGINIRKNFLTDISVPEWVTGGQNEAAAYIINTTKTIKARFVVQPSSIQSAKIRAVSIDNTGSLDDVQERTVNFANGISDPEYVEFNILGEGPKSVQKTTTDRWQWKVSDLNGSNSPEVNINISGPHVIYSTIGAPQSPMPEPWTEVLDYICVWAKGKTDEKTVVEKITINAYSKLGKNYDGGITHAPGTSFNLTSFLADPTNRADCRDMSALVHVFSRAIGDTNTKVRMINDPDPSIENFITKNIDPIGSPSWGSEVWNFHQVATYSGVYDASLRLDQNLPRIPVDEDINGSYKNDLLESGAWLPKAPFDYVVVY